MCVVHFSEHMLYLEVCIRDISVHQCQLAWQNRAELFPPLEFDILPALIATQSGYLYICVEADSRKSTVPLEFEYV